MQDDFGMGMDGTMKRWENSLYFFNILSFFHFLFGVYLCSISRM